MKIIQNLNFNVHKEVFLSTDMLIPYVLSVAAFELVIELSRSERFCSPQT